MFEHKENLENTNNTENTTPQEMPEDILAWLTKANEIRLNLPEEQEYPWLTFLLDAYAIIDGASFCALEDIKKKNKILKEKNNCEHFCLKQIDVSPLEAMGIRLAIQKLLPKIEREAIYKNISENKSELCPFYLENYCSISALKPISCRHSIALENSEQIIYADKAALYAAYAHTSQVYASLGIVEKGQTLTFDNFTELFVDIRSINWLK